MQLYTSDLTPFGRKVMVQILESGLMDRVEVISVTGSPLDAASMPVDRNPLGKIPALVTDGGAAIFDSRVICRYLDDLSGAGLYPKGAALWPVLTLEAAADGILDAALLMVYESRLRPAQMQFAPWVEGQWAKVERALGAVETGSLAPLEGPLNMGQIALAAALGYLDFRLAARDWRAERPALDAWAARMSQRPSMAATAPRA